MKLQALLVAAGLLLVPGMADAKFAQPQLLNVPVSKLLANLEGRLKTPKASAEDRAMLEFQIGRLHSMAYAIKSEEIECQKNDMAESVPGSFAMRPFFGFAVTDYTQFTITEEKNEAKLKQAKSHLHQAIQHLRSALELKPSLDQARLGLAWCLDQSGEKAQALPLYRKVLKSSYEREQNGRGLQGTSVVDETVDYMIPLLDQKSDAVEIADLKSKKERVSARFRAITPIVVPMRSGVRDQELMQTTSVVFDLDGNGPRTYSSWPSQEAGWLVYDGKGTGKITSGLELFGASTFWIFWQNGYEALSALDADNNGSIEGAEKEGLAIWRDANCDGVSAASEVRSLDDCGIESLSCRAQKGAKGFLYSRDGVRFKNGEVGHTVDWVVQSR